MRSDRIKIDMAEIDVANLRRMVAELERERDEARAQAARYREALEYINDFSRWGWVDGYVCWYSKIGTPSAREMAASVLAATPAASLDALTDRIRAQAEQDHAEHLHAIAADPSILNQMSRGDGTVGEALIAICSKWLSDLMEKDGCCCDICSAEFVDHGVSPLFVGTDDVSRCAQCVAEAARSQVEQAIHNYAAALGTELARQAPEAAPLPKGTDVAALLAHVMAKVRAEALEQQAIRMEKSVDHFQDHAEAQMMLKLNAKSLRDKAAEIRKGAK